MSKHRHEKAKERHKRAEGGASMGAKGSYVDKVAHEEGDGGHKKGGRVKRKAGGHVEGKKAHHHLGRPGRKRGGGVGADAKPLTEAAKLTQPKGKDGDDQPDEDIRSPRASGGGCSGDKMKTGGRTKDFHPGGEKGKLHRELGIPESEKIGAARIAAAIKSRNPEIRRDANRARTMSHWKH